MISDRFNDIFRQDALSNLRTLKSVSWNLNYNNKWTTQDYALGINPKDRIGIAWYKLGVWNLRHSRENFDANKSPLCPEPENDIHVIFECKKKKNRRMIIDV